VQHSRSSQNIASNSRNHSSSDHNARKPVAHTQLASRSTGHDKDRVVHHSSTNSRDHDRNVALSRSSSSARHSSNGDRDRVVHHSSTNSRDHDRNLALSRARTSDHHSSSSPRYASSSSHHHDRSHYSQRHDHHSSQWYRDNGWSYDRDYYSSHHQHRYCNDSLGVYIIENTAPYYSGYGYDSGYGYGSGYGYDSGYGYGYSQPAPVYRDRSYYGVDYETRLAVQDALAQAGYYNGPIDGIVGAGTRSAIANYQYDNNLPETGVIDNMLVQSLGL
jgi:hypothetical protein